MRGRITGYIVTTGYPYYLSLELVRYEDSPLVLLHGDRATLFRNRKTAKAAIKRSKVYSEARGYTWGCDSFKIIPVQEHNGKTKKAQKKAA